MAQLLQKTVWRFLKELQMELPHDSAIPLLATYPKELKAGSQGEICRPMFITPLFTITTRQKQPMCPSMDEWMS